jgi:hypothetical protein
MHTKFRMHLFRRITGALTAICALALFGGCATQSTSMQGENPALAKARIELADAEKTRSDPGTSVAHYLGAAEEAAARAAGAEPNEARPIYNAACQGVTVELRSSPALWNLTETIASPEGSYRLRFDRRLPQGRHLGPGLLPFLSYPQAGERDGPSPGGAA